MAIYTAVFRLYDVTQKNSRINNENGGGKMKKVELKVDVINQLVLYRTATFKDKLAFLDEDVQNAQRAGAKNVWIETDLSTRQIRIKNDGVVLDDPQNLFTMAESGWDEDIKENENPFGLGFFSNISVSPIVEIVSGEYHIIFDVDRVISERNPEAIEINQLDSPQDGFELVLREFDFDQIYPYYIYERVETLGKYAQGVTVYYNGTEIDKADILDEDNDDPDLIRINEPFVKGAVKLQDIYISKVKLFHRGRFVKDLSCFPGLTGDLHIEDRALNLTAPDRKDIIQDDKLRVFTDLIKAKVREYCMNVINTLDKAKLDSLSRVMEDYIPPEELVGKLPLMILKDKEDYEFIYNVIRIKKEHYIGSYSDVQYHLRKAKESRVEAPEEIEIDLGLRPIMETYRSGGYSGGGGYSAPEPVIDTKEETVYVENEYLIVEPGIKFWVSLYELERYEKQIDMVRQYRLRLILARNHVESKLLTHLGPSNGIVHISNLDCAIKVRAHIQNAQPINRKEERMIMLLDLVSRLAGLEKNVFVLGDLKVQRILTIEDQGLNEIVEEKDIAVIKHEEWIFIDRNYIRDKYSRQDLSSKMSIQDYKFILANLDEFSKQLAMIKDEEPEKIYKKIVEGLAS